jgi:predicted amidohydrolase YtcJ
VINGSPARSAEVILRNGRIHGTVSSRPDGSAIAIAAGRVLAIGTDREVDDLRGPATDVRDLAGRAVLPGLIDSHTHLHRAAVVRRLSLDFATLAPASIADILGHVAGRAGGLPADAWIQGDSLSASGLAEGRLPNRHELDAAGGGRPVVLRGIGKHVIAASSAALAAAAIDTATVDPPGGRIERDAEGRPSGVLHERAKLRLDSSDPETVVPSPTRDERLRALRAVFADVHALGITTIHEMIRLPEEADDLASLHAAGELPLRVRLWYRVHETPITLDHLATLGIRRGLGDDRFRVLGVKVSVDGWCIFGNAAVHEPYPGQPDNRGLLRIEPAALADLVSRANGRGLGVAVHAVGARAVDATLDAFTAAGPSTGGPYRLEHGHVDMDAARLRRMRDLDVVWSVQPALLSAYRRDWQAVFGRDRMDRFLPLATAAALGIPTLHNSDVPSGPQAPLEAIRAAVSRDAGDGTCLGPDQAIPLELAWRGWTTLPAWSAGDPDLGVLRAGVPADVIVVPASPFVATIEPGSASAVVATMIDGRFVHGADELTT